MKIVIAEDDPVSRRLLEAMLTKWGYSVIVTCDGNEALEALSSEDTPRLAILDWMMPGMDGTEVCRWVRNSGGEAYTYIILLTSLGREEHVVAGMEAGADDYITKPFKANELKVRLRAGRRIIDLQNELIAAREALRMKASHDPLTGLWNHEEILLILGKELSRAEREGQCVGVIMADLDHFKMVNDCYGHMTGDLVLHSAADRMLSLLRPYDSIGRYGGEEFLIVLPGCDKEHALTVAERLREGVAKNRTDAPGGMLQITISLGVAVGGRERGGTVNSLVRGADRALYRAKENGRNRVEAVSDNEIALF